MARRTTRYYKPKRRKLGGGRAAQATFHRNRSTSQPRHVQIHIVRKIVSAVFLGASSIWFIYFALFSDNFIVKSYTVEGTETIPKQELETIINTQLQERRFLFFSNRNMFMFSKNDLQDRIAEKYLVEDIAIDKQFPFELHINVHEKLARVILRTRTPIHIEPEVVEDEESTEQSLVSHNNEAGEEDTEEESSTKTNEPEEVQEPTYAESLYYLDVNGIIVSQDGITENELQLLPVIEIDTDADGSLHPGDVVFERDTVEYIFSIYEAFNASKENLKVSYVHYDASTPNELVITMSEGWEVFLSTRVALETQIKKLELALQEKIGSDRETIQYVDLRVKDRVYFK